MKCELAIYVSAYTTAKGLPSKNILGQKVNIQRFLSHLPRGARHSTSAVVRVEAASRAWLIIMDTVVERWCPTESIYARMYPHGTGAWSQRFPLSPCF